MLFQYCHTKQTSSNENIWMSPCYPWQYTYQLSRFHSPQVASELCLIFLPHNYIIISSGPEVDISWGFCKTRLIEGGLISDNSAFVHDTHRKATAEQRRAVVSVCGSLCLCEACENTSTWALCGMRNPDWSRSATNGCFYCLSVHVFLSTHMTSPWVCQSCLCMGFSAHVELLEEEPMSK